METAIGVFTARERAEEAVKSLLEHHVPEDRIIYLTRSESEAKNMGKQLGACAGGFVGGAAGTPPVLRTLCSDSGVGPVFIWDSAPLH
jgi:hypothetical protein